MRAREPHKTLRPRGNQHSILSKLPYIRYRETSYKIMVLLHAQKHCCHNNILHTPDNVSTSATLHQLLIVTVQGSTTHHPKYQIPRRSYNQSDGPCCERSNEHPCTLHKHYVVVYLVCLRHASLTRCPPQKQSYTISKCSFPKMWVDFYRGQVFGDLTPVNPHVAQSSACTPCML